MAKKTVAEPDFDAELDFENDLEPGVDETPDAEGETTDDDLSSLVEPDEDETPDAEGEGTEEVAEEVSPKPAKGGKSTKKAPPAAEDTAKEGVAKMRKLSELKPSKGVRATKVTPEADAELKASIETAGLQTPLTVLPDGTITDGNRRYRALKALGWDEVPVWEVTGLDEIESGLAASLAREELNPYDRALAIKKLVDRYGDGGQSKVARLIGRSPAMVTEALHLLEADPDTQHRVQKSGKLARGDRAAVRKTAKAKQPQKAKSGGGSTGRPRGRPITMITLVPEEFGSPKGYEEMVVYRDAVRVRLLIPVPEGKVPTKFSHTEAGAAVLKGLTQKAFIQAVNTVREELGPAKAK